MISCQRCRAANPDSSRFCEACGVALAAPCPACGAFSSPSAHFCGQCGTPLSAIEAAAAQERQPQFPEEGERKQVSVLFADIRGSTQLIEKLDPEAAMGQLDPTLETMAEAVKRFGGVVNSVRGDGIMALFGVPVACEDHAVRACLAARSMIEAARSVHAPSIRIRVGVDSGEVVIRTTGSDASDYDATGVVAHIANRVEQHAAPGSVFVTGRTARLARGHVTVSPLGLVPVKGISEPVEMFELLEAAHRTTWEARSCSHALNTLVGRGAELHQLSAALGRAGMGCGQVVILVAEPGYGKSRLAYEFLRDLPGSTWNVLGVAAAPHTRDAPWRLAADLLRAVLAVNLGDDRAEVARKLGRTLAVIDPAAHVDLAPLQSLLDLPIDEESWPRLAPPVRRDRTVAALRTVVLREASVRPLVLLVEDYHWADPASTHALDSIVEGMGAARLLLLVTSRPERYPSWNRRSYCLQLQLPALEPDSARRLLRELVATSHQFEALCRQIIEQAGGVPLFIEEIARSLIESGVLGNEHSVEGATLEPTVVIPASVQGIIAARIDRLPAKRRRLLQVASVIGKDVAHDLLEAVAGLSPHDLEEELAALQSSEFVYELSTHSGREYTFKHVLIQTVAYEEMLLKTRRELHVRVLAAMQSHLADRQEELTERLADHALRGEAWEDAVRYAIKAGDRATGRWAWRSAIGFYERAIEALGHLPQDAEQTIRAAIEARLRLRVALPGVADLPRIAECLAEARTLALRLGDPAKVAEIETSQCLTQTKMGRLADAVDAGRRGYALARELGEKAPLLNAGFALAQADWYRGDFNEARSLIQERLVDIQGELRLRNTGTTGTASLLALVCLAKTHAITGRLEDALTTIAQASAVAQDSGKPFDRSYGDVGWGFCLLMRGDHEGAVSKLEEALRIARAADVALLIPSSQRYLGRAYALVGRRDDAQETLRDCIARTTAAGLIGMRLWSQAAMVLAISRDAPGAAASLLSETLRDARAYGFRPLEASLLHMAGSLQASEGTTDSETAEACLRGALSISTELGMRPEMTSVEIDLARLLGQATRQPGPAQRQRVQRTGV